MPLVGKCLLILLGLMVGCKSTENDQDRDKHVLELHDKLKKISKELRPEDGKLTLERSIEIALENNLDLRIAELNRRLSKLDSQAAFSAFLPQVQFGVSSFGTDRPRMMDTGAGYAQTTDQHASQAVLSAQQAVFTPQAWFIYQMRRKGEDISDLIAKRIEQQIRLKVTAEYYACLMLDVYQTNVDADIKQTTALVKEMKAKEAEGLILPADRMEAENLLLSQINFKGTVQRGLKLARAELFTTLSIWPLYDVKLTQPAPVKIEVPELLDAVYTAMRNRLELHVADRSIDMEEANVKRALAAFLPNLGLTAGVSRSTDSYIKYATVWDYGLHGVMTVFDGFRNVAAYKAAKVKREQSFLRREQQCFSIMLQVGVALGILKDARSNVQLAQAAFDVSAKRLAEAEARKREGLIEDSSYLKALTTHAKSRTSVMIAQYRLAVAHASLQDTIGKTQTKDATK